MKDWFSYFDILAYLAPGFLLLWAARQSLRFADFLGYFETGNWVFESLTGLILAFVLGQLISARARARFESRTGLRRPVFHDGLISENFLLKERVVYGQHLCSEPRRLVLVEMAAKHCHLSANDVGQLNAWQAERKVAQQLSHRIYRPLLTLLADEEIGEKAQTMNIRYVFFRNLNVAAAYGSALFLGSGFYSLSRHIPLTDPKVVLAGVLAALFALTATVSRREAVHFAINHVREVFDSAEHFHASRQR